MPLNTYITANGRIRRRITTNGGAVTDDVAVVTNALGSVVATYKDGWLTADRSYDPYGETRAEWNDVGRFGWVGGLGYRETRREWVSHYVRARHYGFTMGMWTSVDPLWPTEAAFGYVANPLVATDGSGLRPDLVNDYFNKLFPPGEGVPNWIMPDAHRARCISNWNPLTWAYGRCCGTSRKCNSKSKTYDCLDAACKEHDGCLATVKEYVNPVQQHKCNSRFCNDILYCYSKYCLNRPIDRKQCQAMFEAGTFYCALVGRSGPPAWSPGG